MSLIKNPEFKKEQVKMPDGRYIIYYDFELDSEKNRPNQKKQVPNNK